MYGEVRGEGFLDLLEALSVDYPLRQKSTNIQSPCIEHVSDWFEMVEYAGHQQEVASDVAFSYTGRPFVPPLWQDPDTKVQGSCRHDYNTHPIATG